MKDPQGTSKSENPGTKDPQSEWPALETEQRKLINEERKHGIEQIKTQSRHNHLCDRIEHARRNLEILSKMSVLSDKLVDQSDLKKAIAANLAVLNEVSSIGRLVGRV